MVTSVVDASRRNASIRVAGGSDCMCKMASLKASKS